MPKTATTAPANALTETCSLWRNIEKGMMHIGNGIKILKEKK